MAVAPTPAIAAAALRSLLAGPTPAAAAAGLASAIPAGTQLRSVTITGAVATADLDATFLEAGGSGIAMRLAEVVFTLTQFPTVRSVQVETDGRPVDAPPGAGSNPLARASFPALTPPILVDTPAPGDVVASPLTVRGSANTFEGATSFRVLDATGQQLAQSNGTGGTIGAWSPFSARLTFPPPQTVSGTVVAFDRSAKDGSMIDVVTIPVTFG